ncbi:DUF6662 family protein [Roseateles sp. NT4]|uniref:DUF6662 family protein n=1 Tax=Roseateles sp. NT4 TaxID=3453715 RepID=UPI003EE9B741
MTKHIPLALAATLALALTPAAQASEPLFGYTYTAETLPANALEGEIWSTYRAKKSQGTYKLFQNRAELEYGVTDRWTMSFYVNRYSVVAENNNSIASRNNYMAIGDGDEVTGGGPVTFGSYVPFLDKLPLPASRYKKSGHESVSIESVYQLLSPYKDGIGLAGYVEYTHGPRVRELELKAIVQKNFMEDRLVLAGNLAVELERENWSQLGFEKEAKIELSGGASYLFAPGWRAGVELRNERGYKGHGFGNGARDYSAWFAGPNLVFSAQKWSVNLAMTTQMPWASAYSDAAKAELVDDRVYKSTEKLNARLRVSYSF